MKSELQREKKYYTKPTITKLPPRKKEKRYKDVLIFGNGLGL